MRMWILRVVAVMLGLREVIREPRSVIRIDVGSDVGKFREAWKALK